MYPPDVGLEIKPSDTNPDKRCSYQDSAEQIAAAREFTDRSALTETERDDNRLIATERKENIIETAETTQVSASDPLMDAIKKHKIKITSKEDLWAGVLSKVDVSVLSGAIIGCVMKKLPPEDAARAWCRAQIKKGIEALLGNGELGYGSQDFFNDTMFPIIEKSLSTTQGALDDYNSWKFKIEETYLGAAVTTDYAVEAAQRDYDYAKELVDRLRAAGEP